MRLPQPQHSRTTNTSLTSRRGQVQRNPFPLRLIVLASAVAFVAINLVFLYHFVWLPYSSISSSSSSTSTSTTTLTGAILQSNQQHSGVIAAAAAAGPLSSCEFREYPPHRYYHLSHKDADDARDFLTKDAIYIYGEWPILLPIDQQNAQQVKLCVHQEEWRSSSTTATRSLLPFADGTNPSLLSMSRFQKQAKTDGHVDFVNQLEKQQPGGSQAIRWLATACMTNSQCNWKDSAADAQRYKLNLHQDKPDTVRTLLLFLNEQFETLGQATLHLQRDAPWGRRGQVKALSVSEQQAEEQNTKDRRVFAFDDARLFLHHGQLWISYREGKLYGYDTQVLNPVHLQWANDNSNGNTSNSSVLLSFTATIRASESATLCCGRNMALLERHPSDTSSLSSLPPLQALTWVDPITVVDVDTIPFLQQQKQQQNKHRRLLQQQQESDAADDSTIGTVVEFQRHSEQMPSAPPPPILRVQDVLHLIPNEQQPRRRRLLASGGGAQNEKKKSSHIHGTNAFMVYWPQEDVFLGMGHYHRPNDREANEYARFGHHYTHTLFAIKQSKSNDAVNNKNSRNDYYYLHALSPEFVIPSFHPANKNDAEVIQFASGLEIDDDAQKLVIGYGINDCEAAVVTMDLSKVQALLRRVPQQPGRMQVVDLMQPLLQSHV